MRRRLLPIAAVALAGLLVGAWLSWAPAPPAAPSPAPRPRGARATLQAPATEPAQTDTASPALPSPSPTAHTDRGDAPDIADMVPMGHVRCELDRDDFDELQIVAHAGADVLARGLVDGFSRQELDAGLARPLRWQADGGLLDIDAPVDTMLLAFTIRVGDTESHSTVSVRWRDGAGTCQSTIPTTPPRRIHLAGRVEGVVEGDLIWLSGCSMDRRLGDADRFDSRVTLPDRPCELYATRVDGLIRVRGDGVEIDPAEGDRTDLVLTLPDYDVGGIGAVVEFDPEGLRLGDIHEDSPAEAVGLSEGDVVLEADGEPLAGLPLIDMISAVTGEVGSSVQLRVRSPDGTERVVDAQRAWIGE